MCKNLFIIGATNPTNVEKFVKVMAPIMSRTDNDGIGYAALTSDGNLFSEKWLKNNMAFPSDKEGAFQKKLGNLVSYVKQDETNYASVGTKDWSKVTSVLLHTRKSTNKVCIENTHPFIIDNTALVHNGIIQNHTQFPKSISTCDTEAILTLYNENHIAENEYDFDNVSTKLEGWYACGVFTKANDTWSMDVFRHSANLFATYIEELGGIVISTSDEYLKEGINKCRFNSTKFYQLEEHIFTRFNPMTGDIVSQFQFAQKPVAVYPKTYSCYGDYDNGYSQTSRNYSGGIKYVFLNFTEWELDKLDDLCDTLPKDEQARYNLMEFEAKYIELRRLSISDRKALTK